MQKAQHFVIVSFDGLRPDLITPELTPNLYRLSKLGITLGRHRTIFPSETRSAFPSLVTGTTTRNHGMVGNQYIDRDGLEQRLIDTSNVNLLRQLDLASGGNLMSAPTLGQILATAKRTFAVLASNTAGTTRLFHHNAEDVGHVRLSGVFAEACTPSTVLAGAINQLGPLALVPPKGKSDFSSQDWITSAFLDIVWPQHRPDVTVISYGEPDTSSHYIGVGAAATHEIVAHCDRQFGRVLDWWEAEGRGKGVQMMAISDHGHIAGHTRVSVVDRPHC